MKTSKASVNFVLREDKMKSNGLCPIYLIINFHGRVLLSTRAFCKVKDWDSKRQFVKKSEPNYKFINATLQKILGQVNEMELFYISRGMDYTSRDLLKTSATVVDFNKTLFEGWMRQLINERQLSYNSAKTYEAVLSVMKDYCGTDKVRLNEINESNINLFVRWLQSKKLKENSILAYLKYIKSVQNYAYQKGAIRKETVITKPNVKLIPTNRLYYFNLEQMKLVKESILSTKRDEYLYLFLWLYKLNGSALVDAISLKYKNVLKKTINDEEYYIFTFQRQKTKRNVKCILSSDEEIIKNFFLLSYKPEKHSADDYIFDYLRFCKTDKERANTIKNVGHTIQNHVQFFLLKLNNRIKDNKLEIPQFEINKVSAYTARHTFASIYLNTPNTSVLSLANLLGRSPDTISTYAHQFLSDRETLEAYQKLPV